jgi:hypothetical protein
MNLFISAYIFWGLFSSLAFAENPTPHDTVKFVNTSLFAIESFGVQPNQCLAIPKIQNLNCPMAIIDSYKDIYRRGTVGVINQIVSDGSLKNPRTVCATGADQALKIKTTDLYSELHSQYPDSKQLAQVSTACDTGIDVDKNNNLAANFMAYDFNYKTDAIRSALTELLNSKAQINAMIANDSDIDCQKIEIEDVKKHCEELKNCSPQNRNHLTEMKTEELTHILTTLNVEIKTHNDSINRLTDKEKIKEAKLKKEALINGVIDLNPILKGERFKKIIKNSLMESDNAKVAAIKPIDVANAFKAQLIISQKNIQKKISDYNSAYQCLIGKNNTCEHLNDLIKESQYKNKDIENFKKPALASIANFYNCVENIADNRNVADKVVNESLIGSALTLTPFALVSGAKLAVTAARAANAASKIVRVEGAVNSANIAANVAYGGYQSKEVYDQCKAVENEFIGLVPEQAAFSCENIDNILINKSNSTKCSTQALISAAALAPLAAPSAFRLAKLLKKPAIGKSKFIVDQEHRKLAAEAYRYLRKSVKDAPDLFKKSNQKENLAHTRRLMKNLTDSKNISELRKMGIDTDALLTGVIAHDMGKGGAAVYKAAVKTAADPKNLTDADFFRGFMLHEEFAIEMISQRGKDLGMSEEQIKRMVGTIENHNGPGTEGSWWKTNYEAAVGKNYEIPQTKEGYIAAFLDRGDQGSLAVTLNDAGKKTLIGGPRKILTGSLGGSKPMPFADAVQNALENNPNGTLAQLNDLVKLNPDKALNNSAIVKEQFKIVEDTKAYMQRIHIGEDKSFVLVDGKKVGDPNELFDILASKTP